MTPITPFAAARIAAARERRAKEAAVRTKRGGEYASTMHSRAKGQGAGILAIDMKSDFPELWKSLYVPHPKASAKSVAICGIPYANAEKLGWTHARFEAAIQMVTRENILAWRQKLTPMDCFSHKDDECRAGGESEDYFAFELQYAMTFWLFLATKCHFPSEEQFYEFWQECNQKAMGLINLCPRAAPTDEFTTYDVCLGHLKADNPSVTQGEVKDHIWRAAKYRCGKALAGFVRELYIIASVSEGFSYMTDAGKEGDRIDVGAVLIGIHPMMDIAGKMDLLGFGSSADVPPCGIAVYLNSQKSDVECKRKSSNIPRDVVDTLPCMLSVSVDQDRASALTDAPFLPTNDYLCDLVDVINGDRQKLQNFRGHYTHMPIEA